jgi:hypothetical protein
MKQEPSRARVSYGLRTIEFVVRANLNPDAVTIENLTMPRRRTDASFNRSRAVAAEYRSQIRNRLRQQMQAPRTPPLP